LIGSVGHDNPQPLAMGESPVADVDRNASWATRKKPSLKPLLLRPDNTLLLLRSANISINYPVFGRSNALSSRHNRHPITITILGF
jgi:hypothetical protein